MKKRLFPLILLAALSPVQAQEGDGAKELYSQHCVQCHASEVYTRPERKVTSLDGLQRQVRRCELALGLKWFDEDILDMTHYLNVKFYHFEP
jgi:cytochrome c553